METENKKNPLKTVKYILNINKIQGKEKTGKYYFENPNTYYLH